MQGRRGEGQGVFERCHSLIGRCTAVFVRSVHRIEIDPFVRRRLFLPVEDNDRVQKGEVIAAQCVRCGSAAPCLFVDGERIFEVRSKLRQIQKGIQGPEGTILRAPVVLIGSLPRVKVQVREDQLLLFFLFPVPVLVFFPVIFGFGIAVLFDFFVFRLCGFPVYAFRILCFFCSFFRLLIRFRQFFPDHDFLSRLCGL